MGQVERSERGGGGGSTIEEQHFTYPYSPAIGLLQI